MNRKSDLKILMHQKTQIRVKREPTLFKNVSANHLPVKESMLRIYKEHLHLHNDNKNIK